jgi:hypothetical protein
MWRKNHRAGPSFATVAVAGDVDGECISEQDLIQDKTRNGGNGPDWGQLPSQYTADGCVDEAEFNLIMQGLGIKHARAVGEYMHRFSVCLPLRFACQGAHTSAPYLCMSSSSCFSTIPMLCIAGGAGGPSLDAMCSECGTKMMQALSMFAPGYCSSDPITSYHERRVESPPTGKRAACKMCC